MGNLWYILVTRHFDGGREEKELHMGQYCAFECNSKEHAIEIIAEIKEQPCKLEEGEHARTYEPIPYSALDAIFPNRTAS